jgi:WS/DGAT/MGAT family acyltransferase
VGQGHGQRLTSLDTAFLAMESPQLHMHVGGIFTFRRPAPDAGPAFTFERFLALMRSRLHLVPRYRQKLAFTPLNLANPIWVDDVDFDLAYHVRHAALPRPGSTAQLTEYAARLFSRGLDRERPLWELYVVDGLADGGFALIGKNHHAMIDGISGIDIATVLMDTSPHAPETFPAPEPWNPQPVPSDYDLTAAAVTRLVASPRALAERTRAAIGAPADLARKTLRIGRGVTSFARNSVSRLAPKTIINQHPGVNRRFGIRQLALADVKQIKNTFRTSVNDVVLTLVADTVGRYLRGRGESTRGLELRAMVPVSVRSDDGEAALGNQVAATFVDLPVDEMDPIRRLEVVAGRMGGIKSSHSAVGADFLLDLSEFAPPTLHALGARAAASSRVFNFVVTNVPGPQVPIYLLGARLDGGYPLVPLAAFQSLAVGLTSLDGRMSFGFSVDYDAIPDPERLGDLLEASLADLAASADARRERQERAQQPTAPTDADAAGGGAVAESGAVGA